MEWIPQGGEPVPPTTTAADSGWLEVVGQVGPTAMAFCAVMVTLVALRRDRLDRATARQLEREHRAKDVLQQRSDRLVSYWSEWVAGITQLRVARDAAEFWARIRAAFKEGEDPNEIAFVVKQLDASNERIQQATEAMESARVPITLEEDDEFTQRINTLSKAVVEASGYDPAVDRRKQREEHGESLLALIADKREQLSRERRRLV